MPGYLPAAYATGFGFPAKSRAESPDFSLPKTGASTLYILDVHLHG